MSQLRRVLDPVVRDGDAFVKLSTAADTLAVTKVTMRRMIAAGYLPAWRLAGSGELRVRASDVAGLLTPVPAAWNDFLQGGPTVREVQVIEPAETVVVVPSPAADPDPVPSMMMEVDPATVADPSRPQGYADAHLSRYADPVNTTWPAKDRHDETEASYRGVL